jgi:chorismate mutase/prephenate dehydratase
MKKFREKIDTIDENIVKLLNERAKAALEIGKYKKEKKINVVDFHREKEVIANVLSKSDGIIPEKDILNIYREIIAATRKLQESYKVSFLGPTGTFSSIAFKKFFGNNTEYKERNSIESVFNDVDKEYSMFGIVPVENSLEGSVNETLECLFGFNVKIWAEISLKISFNLFSNCRKKEYIKKIVSHSHAVAQCRNFISKNFPHVKVEFAESTAKAVEKALKDKYTAAIASPYISDIYKLSPIFENIEDNANNFTRFYIISLKENKTGKKEKSSFIFSISHQPKTLFKVLEVISKYNLNMCKIESRPIKGIPWEYLFFIDIENLITEEFLKEFKVKTTFMKYLGSFPVEKI